jgi:hypothetical protein
MVLNPITLTNYGNAEVGANKKSTHLDMMICKCKRAGKQKAPFGFPKGAGESI